jgi:hypothetical protein
MLLFSMMLLCVEQGACIKYLIGEIKSERGAMYLI